MAKENQKVGCSCSSCSLIFFFFTKWDNLSLWVNNRNIHSCVKDFDTLKTQYECPTCYHSIWQYGCVKPLYPEVQQSRCSCQTAESQRCDCCCTSRRLWLDPNRGKTLQEEPLCLWSITSALAHAVVWFCGYPLQWWGAIRHCKLNLSQGCWGGWGWQLREETTQRSRAFLKFKDMKLW